MLNLHFFIFNYSSFISFFMALLLHLISILILYFHDVVKFFLQYSVEFSNWPEFGVLKVIYFSSSNINSISIIKCQM